MILKGPPLPDRISAALAKGAAGAWRHPRAAVSEPRSLLSPDRCVHHGCHRQLPLLLFPPIPHFPPGTALGRASRAAALQRRPGRSAQPARAWHRRCRRIMGQFIAILPPSPGTGNGRCPARAGHPSAASSRSPRVTPHGQRQPSAPAPGSNDPGSGRPRPAGQ